jgi:hypothetical protein
MRFQAIKRYYYTAEVWDVTLTDAGAVESEELRGTISLSLDTANDNNLRIDSQVSLGPTTILRDIRDRNGDLIYPSRATNTGVAYVVAAEQPVLNAYGFLEGYTSRARKTTTA